MFKSSLPTTEGNVMDKYSVVQENTTFRVIFQIQGETHVIHEWDETTEPNAKHLAEDFCVRHNQKG